MFGDRFRGAVSGLGLFVLAAGLTACAPFALAQEGPVTSPTTSQFHPNSVQPETTLAITASGEAMREPDIAFITTGVQTEAKTAQDAMAENRVAMNGVFDALRSAGLPDRDIQTSNFSLNPRYEYPRSSSGTNTRVLIGYTVSNMVTAKVSDLDDLGETLDSLVEAGGNTFNGVRFGLEDDTSARNEARQAAMGEALERAELYASAAGYRVSRIVTINEYESQRGPQPQVMMERAMAMDSSAPTPISGGEIGYSVQVNVTFELVK
ncbi:MAG: SIMPL domain-containing protein [Pseudomonadota bacterium]